MSRRRIRKLTDEQVRAIRASTEDAATLAARHGVQRSCIYRVKNGTRKQLPELRAQTARLCPLPEAMIGNVKPAIGIAILHKDLQRLDQKQAAGEVTAAFADSERAWMQQVIEHLQQKIVFAARHPQPSADDF